MKKRTKKYLNEVKKNRRINGRRAVVVSRFLRANSEFDFWVTTQIFANPKAKYRFWVSCNGNCNCNCDCNCCGCDYADTFGFSRI